MRLALRFVAIAWMAIAYTSAVAQGIAPDGAYSSPGASLQVIVLDDSAGTTIASTTVVRGQCTGTVSGKATVTGHTLKITPSSNPLSACRVIAEFDAKWNQVTLRENDACYTFHGASCGWEGQKVSRVLLVK